MTIVQTVLAVTILQQGFFAVAWLILAALRMARRASLTWGLAIVLLTAAMGAVLLRGSLPPAVGAALPNLLNVAGMWLIWRGVRIFVRRPPASAESVGVALAGAAAVAGATAAGAPHGVIVVAAASTMAWLLGRAAMDVHSGLQAEFGRAAALLCALPLAAIAAVLALRAGLVLASGRLQGHALEGNAPLETGLVFSFLAMSLAMNFAMGALVVLRLVNRLRHLSQHDALTRLVNRRGLEQCVEAERQRLQRQGRPFAVLSIDIDHFKAVNDRHGHAAGDQVLVGVAQALRREARGQDIVARMGGEEFALLLPETGATGAQQMAQRLLEALRAEQHEVEGQRLRVTISIGLAVVTDPSESAEALWRRVDAALYRAKAAGRDRVELAGQPPPP